MHASGAEVFISSLLLAEQNLFWEGQSVPPNLRYIVIPLFWRRSRGGPNHLWIYLNTACQHTELSISYFHYRWWNATVSEGLCFTDCQHTELSISYFHYRWWNATVSEGLCFTDCQLHKSAGSAFYTMRSCAAHIRTTKMDHARHTLSLSLSLSHTYTQTLTEETSFEQIRTNFLFYKQSQTKVNVVSSTMGWQSLIKCLCIHLYINTK